MTKAGPEAEVSQLSEIIRKVRGAPAVKWSILALLFLCGGYMLGIMAAEPGKVRLLIFAALFTCLLAFNLRKPQIVLFGLLLYLPFMTFFRRLLIPVAGWSGYDPLLLLAPFTVLLLGFNWVYRTYILREPLEDDTRVFRLVRWLLLIHAIQVFNPLQGGILVGFGGIMFYIVPIFWMILGRKYFNDKRMDVLLGAIFAIGMTGALYGLKQIAYGFSDFELQWVDIAGYAALIVGTGSRAFSFFTSSAEYAQFMVISIVIAWAYLLRGAIVGKTVSLLALPLLMYALFMTGSRGPLIFTAFAITAISMMNAKRAASKIAVAVMAAAVLAALYMGITRIDPSANAVIARQVNGLSNPLDEEHSTLGLHWAMLVGGFLEGFRMPIGYGLGSTTLAGAKMGSTGQNAEVDFANIMISDGLAGGILYLVFMFYVLRLALSFKGAGVPALAVPGILIATVTTWSFGGNYSTCAVIWVMIGFLDMATKRHRSNLIAKEKSG